MNSVGTLRVPPVDISSRISECATHDSEPVWLAVPSLLETVTLYSLPISRRTSVLVPFRVLTRHELFQIIAVLLTLTALFSFIRLPTTFGVMLIALIASLALIALQHFGFSIGPMAARVLQSVDFGQTLLQGM